jgi:NAD(P)-dependent dehydrogenase (short-subunit alcohol dehydrogenase family)
MNKVSNPNAPVALITGGAKRIGRQIALTMAQRGWNVIVHYGNSATQAEHVVTEIVALGRQAVALQCDLSNETQVRQLFPLALAALGRLDCVVNNASLFDPDTASDFSQAKLDQHMHVNVMAPIILAQALYEATADHEQACVINLLDQKLMNLNPDYLSYTLSKAALQCATTTLAQALAPKVRVVGVAPGLSMMSGDQSEHEFQAAHRLTPLGRSSTPEDIAEAVCFVAQARAITGTTILVDGGQHLLPTQRDVMFLTTSDLSK